MKNLLLFLLLVSTIITNAQVGIGTNTPDASAKLEVNSSNKGFLPPRVALTSTTDFSTIASPVAGLLVYCTGTGGLTAGYYYFNGTVWVNLTGNGVPYTGATGAVNLGAYDMTVNGITVGKGGGAQQYNTAFGYDALASNTLGNWNIAVGYNALSTNTQGNYNVAVGHASLRYNTVGLDNSAFGYQSLKSNISGIDNSAFGQLSLLNNTTGSFNTSIGTRSMFNNLYGNNNTAVGWNASTFTGQGASSSTAGGNNNTSLGYSALYSNTLGNDNTALGYSALTTNATGIQNTAIGSGADVASNNLTNATAIGYGATASASNTIQLGNTSVTNVKTNGTLTAGAVTYPNTDGSNGQVLTTNGSGGLTFTTPSSTTVGSIGGSSNANGATITAGVLSLTPADANNGGIVTNGTQTFAGIKTFNGSTNFQNNITVNGIYVGNPGGSQNTMFGNASFAYASNPGSNNTGFGSFTLSTNGGTDNTAIGTNAMRQSSTTYTGGSYNVAVGSAALSNGIAGNNNVAIGYNTLNAASGSDNTAVGYSALTTNTTGIQNTAIGSGANVTYNNLTNATAIGYGATVATSNTIQLGNSAIQILSCSTNVITTTSDRRDKTDIIDISEGIEFVKKLRPVTFTWNARDKSKVGIKAAGFIAQDLLALQKGSKIGDNLDLVEYSNPEKLKARYDNLLPVLTKAIQEQQKQIESQQKEIDQLKFMVNQLINKKN